jgi:hypothetical protein
MIPDWLRDNLANPPQAGAGIHAWLFSVARQLHTHMPPAAVEAALMASTASSARRVTAREIKDAVANSREVAWARAGGSAKAYTPAARAGRHAPDLTRWPAIDLQARAGAIRMSRRDGIWGLGALWAESPRLAVSEGPDDYLDWLFPGAEWLCLAVDHPATARSRPPSKWSFGPADGCGLVVPSPMTGPSGRALDGSTSHRCLDNTGPRRWLVIEFDSGTIDEQAALHWHLGCAAAAMGWSPLRLAAHSGGKSLHGWYGPCADEAQAEQLMMYARTLGADTATWNRCQLVRLPAGRRMVEGKPVLQEVWFWDRDGDLWDGDEKVLWNLTLGKNSSSVACGPPGIAPTDCLTRAG